MSTVRSAYYSMNATSAKIIGILTVLVGFLVIDSYGFVSAALFAIAGLTLFFSAGDQIRTGFNLRNLALVIGYGVLVFLAFCAGAL